ncbi:chlorohydrolase [Streptococcus pneumoniae]|nr:chlorohydrolase [Streptococcus pneumoniae]
MKIKEQTRKLAAGCSKHRFEVADETDEVSHIYNPAGDFRRVLLYFKGLEIIVFSYLTFEGFTIFKVRKVIGY